MSKKEVEKELRRLLSLLTIGNREEVRSAKKAIESLWHKENKAFKKSATVAFEYLSKFDQIAKVENRAALASGLGLFFLALANNYFNILKEFTIKTLQHPNGHVREAIRKTADWLHISLVSRIDPFIYPKRNELNQKEKVAQKEAQLQYIKLVKEVELLIDLYKSESEKVKYIDEMKPSINKSLQLFWSRLTESRVYRKIIEESWPVSSEILNKRKEIENKLIDFLKKTKNNFDLDTIKEIIYHEDGQKDLNRLIGIIDNAQEIYEINNILQVLNDAWNYFPHKSLAGLSPVEKMLEYNYNSKKTNKLPN